jgi:hypothetical protein
MIRVWDVARGVCLTLLNGHKGDVCSLAFSPDGQQLASGSSDGTLYWWGSANENPLHEVKKHTQAIVSVAFSPNDQQLASGSDDTTVRVWDTENGKCLLELKEHKDNVFEVGFLDDGKLLASLSADRTVQVRDVANGELFQEFKGVNVELSFKLRSWLSTSNEDLIASARHDKDVFFTSYGPTPPKRLQLTFKNDVSRSQDAPDGSKVAIVFKDGSGLVVPMSKVALYQDGEVPFWYAVYRANNFDDESFFNRMMPAVGIFDFCDTVMQSGGHKAGKMLVAKLLTMGDTVSIDFNYLLAKIVQLNDQSRGSLLEVLLKNFSQKVKASYHAWLPFGAVTLLLQALETPGLTKIVVCWLEESMSFQVVSSDFPAIFNADSKLLVCGSDQVSHKNSIFLQPQTGETEFAEHLILPIVDIFSSRQLPDSGKKLTFLEAITNTENVAPFDRLTSGNPSDTHVIGSTLGFTLPGSVFRLR